MNIPNSSLILIICLSQFVSNVLFAQQKGMPDWLKGSWTNAYQSNSNLTETLTFCDDIICISSALGSKTQTCLFSKYKGFIRRFYVRNDIYRITMTKGKKKIIYEFILKEGICGKAKVLSYALTINGKKEKLHSTICNSCFIKIE